MKREGKLVPKCSSLVIMRTSQFYKNRPVLLSGTFSTADVFGNGWVSLGSTVTLSLLSKVLGPVILPELL